MTGRDLTVTMPGGETVTETLAAALWSEPRLFPVPPSPQPLGAEPVLAVTDWPTNGHLIEAVAELGYLRPSDRVLDVTYGRGLWWSRWQPAELITHDLALDGVDFRALPERDASVDVVAFDPPYVPGGTSANNNTAEYRDRYGLDNAPRSSAELLELIVAGFTECARVVRPGGFVLVKCQPYQAGKVFHHVPARLIAHAEQHVTELGLRLVDEFVHRRRPGPTSTDTFHRARGNRSHLLVFDRRQRRPKRARNAADPLRKVWTSGDRWGEWSLNSETVRGEGRWWFVMSGPAGWRQIAEQLNLDMTTTRPQQLRDRCVRVQRELDGGVRS